MRLGWNAVTLGGLRSAFGENKLDGLARALVRIEMHDRRAEVETLEGPAPPGVGDGGREVEVSLRAPPAQAEAEYLRRFSLTFSLLGDATCIAISCKTGRDLASVRQDAKKDANPNQEGGARVVEVLRGGGRLVLLTTQTFTATAPPRVGPMVGSRTTGTSKARPKRQPATAAGKPSLIAELAKAYAAQTGRSESVITSQIVVVDGNDLVEYLDRRRPIQLGDELLRQIGVTDWPTVRSHARALDTLAAERSLPTYLSDESRTLLTTQIQSLVRVGNESHNVLCVVGPPGVGKTRCVLESMQGAETRVLYVLGDDAARELLTKERLLSNTPDGILIVDDARPEKVRSLVNDFRGAQDGLESTVGHSSPGLVVIVPAGTYDADLFPDVEIVRLGPLSEDEARALIVSSLGSHEADERVLSIYRVTQGYPWFGILVAQEISKGVRVPETTTSAAKLAICPEEIAEEKRLPRARTLLAAMLVHEARWDDLPDADRDKLARAVDLADRRELETLLGECVKRGVLRKDAWLYVTPGILEREIWRILHEYESPDPVRGPRRILDRIRAHVPGLVDSFVARLSRLTLTIDEGRALARALLDALQTEVRTLDDLTPRHHAATVQCCVRNLPQDTARWLSKLVLEAPESALRTRTEIRRMLVHGFDLLARRVTDFAVVEAPLFAMRLAENEAYANNASAIWVLLFHPEFDLTAVPLDQRLQVLTHRCLEETPVARLSAIRGLHDLLRRGASVLVSSDDPAPRSLSASEQRRARETFWSLLLRCVSDPDPTVANVAQRVLVAVSRAANDLLAYMPDNVEFERAMHSLSESTRSSLRRELNLERRFEDGSGIRSTRIFSRIEELTRPQGYAQRLGDHLAQYHFSVQRDEVDATRLDEALVREGLVPPDYLLVRHVEVLLGEETERATPFALVAGKVDEDCLLFDPFVARVDVSTGPNVLSAYCAGHHLVGRTQRVERWLLAWQHDARFATTVVLTAARCRGAEPLLRIALETLRTQAIAPGVYRFFATAAWRDAPDGLLMETLRLLVDLPHPGAAGAALCLLRQRLHHRDANTFEAIAVEVMTVAADVVEPADAWYFEECLQWLLDRGHARSVSELFLRRVSAQENPGLSTLNMVGDISGRFPDVFWETLRSRLEADESSGARAVSRLELSGAHIQLPWEDVLAWVGLDASRAQRVVPLVDLDDDTLSPLAAGLIARFGSSSSLARDLASALHATPRPVSSLARFYEERLERVARWAQLGSPAVKEWAVRASEALARDHAWHVDDEAAERRRYGT